MATCKTFTALALFAGVSVGASAAVTTTTTHSATFDFFNPQLSNTDLIAGLLATELPGDAGWHPQNPATGLGSDSSFGLPAFTNGTTDGGLSGLLNDFPLGNPTKQIQYDLPAPADIGGINVLTGNENPDGRVFSTFRVLASTDNGASFNPIEGFAPGTGSNSAGYFESNALGDINSTSNGILPDDTPARATLVEITDDTGVIASGVTNLQFFFFAVDNSQGQYRDPFEGTNPFTGVDDGLNQAFVSPLLWEIDVFAAEATGVNGDYNDSGQVEQGDLDLVLQNWGVDTDVAGVPTGWVNDLPSGQIEQTELDGVLQNWGATSAPDFSGSAVPEPTTLALLGGLGLLGARRRG